MYIDTTDSAVNTDTYGVTVSDATVANILAECWKK
jgi:hypothetical protein